MRPGCGGAAGARIAHPVRLVPAPRYTRPMLFDAPCKLLRIRRLTKIRVMVFTTLKTPKPLLLNGLQVAFLHILSVRQRLFY